LLISSIVSGPQNYAVMERWKLSRDHNVLTIRRQIQKGVAESEAVLVYRNQHPSEVEKPPGAATPATPAPSSPTTRPSLPPQSPAGIVVPAGTKVPLALVSVRQPARQLDWRLYCCPADPIWCCPKGRRLRWCWIVTFKEGELGF
jgi:hypothetical protein